MEKKREDKIIEMIGSLSSRIDKKIDDLSNKVDKIDERTNKMDLRIGKIDERANNTDARLDSLAEIVAQGFTDMHDKFDQIDSRFDRNDIQHNNIMNILDNHTKLLLDNRAERAATISRCDRLEGEIIKIKRKVKIA